MTAIVLSDQCERNKVSVVTAYSAIKRPFCYPDMSLRGVLSTVVLSGDQ